MTNSNIRSIAKQVFEIDEQVEDLKISRKAILDAAKEAGINSKALNQAIKIHRMESDKRAAHEQQQMDIELYLAELEGKRLEAVA